MPQSGETMEEGTVITWLKREGDPVRRGEAVVEIETDKALIEVESPHPGILRRILCPEGETVPVCTPLALIGEADEELPEPIGTGGSNTLPAREVSPEPTSRRTPGDEALPSAKAEIGGIRVPASPAARRLTAGLGIDLASLAPGSGPGGRILFGDVEAAIAAQRDLVRRPLGRMRRAVARNLAAAWSSIPHFYVRSTVDAEPLLAFLENERSNHPCTINDVIVLACGRTLREFSAFRSRLDGEDLIEFPGSDIGIAVGTEEGLLVPTIGGVDRMSLADLARESARLIGRARNRRLEIRGRRTFTVSNLGMHGVDEFAAIIFPPDTAILAVGAVRDEAGVKDGAVRPGKRMTLTLGCDHRIIDGVLAAKFLARLRELIENPMLLNNR